MLLSRAWYEEKRKITVKNYNVIWQHDNGGKHLAITAKNYLKTLQWKLLPQPPCSLNVFPFDCWFYRRILNDLVCHWFESFEEIWRKAK